MNQTQDTKELRSLAINYICPRRCKGGRYVHPNYCCSWCGSDDPGNECGKPRNNTPADKRWKDYYK